MGACLLEADKSHSDSFPLASEICLALGLPLESSWRVKVAQDIDPPHCYFFENGVQGKREYNSDEDYDDIHDNYDGHSEEEQNRSKFYSNEISVIFLHQLKTVCRFTKENSTTWIRTMKS